MLAVLGKHQIVSHGMAKQILDRRQWCRSGLFIAILAWSLLVAPAGATPTGFEYPLTEPSAGLNGASLDSLAEIPIERALPSREDERSGSASFVLPMAIFCGMLLSSMSIAIGIGYKRRFDAVAADHDDDSDEDDT